MSTSRSLTVAMLCAFFLTLGSTTYLMASAQPASAKTSQRDAKNCRLTPEDFRRLLYVK